MQRQRKQPDSLRRFFRRLYVAITTLSWRVVLPLGAAHIVLSWWGLLFAGEDALLPLNTFWYFYATTATTVGYGDLSPTTPIGRYVVTLFVMPGGITLFTSVLAKLAQNFTNLWRRAMTGRKSYEHLEGHIVLIGWHGDRSNHMLALIAGDEAETREIVLMAELDENPAPDHVHYVHANGLADEAALIRAGAPHAALIIAVGADDNLTLTAGLAAGAMNADAHLVAYFAEDGPARLMERHCPNAECVISMSMENTVRAAQDPGSSYVLKQLLSSMQGQTQFRIAVPEAVSALSFGAVCATFKERHDAIVLGLRNLSGAIQLNPPAHHALSGGEDIYYIANRRLQPDEVNWTVQ